MKKTALPLINCIGISKLRFDATNSVFCSCRAKLCLTCLILLITFGKICFSDVIDADNPNIQYIGRVSFSNPKAPKFDWPGVYISAVFEGTSCSVKFTEGGSNYYNAFLDAQPAVVLVGKSTQTVYNVATGLSDTSHTIMITKRTEAEKGATTFQGFVLDSGKTLLTPPARPNRRIEFIGDSYTCGYGNEANFGTTGNPSLKENNYLAFGPVVARNFNADYQIAGWSGKGMVRNYGDSNQTSTNPFPVYYERTLGNTAVNDWSFSWVPDVVVLYLGINDFSTTPNPSQTQFETGYSNFLTTIRTKYANAEIFCVCNTYDDGINKTYLTNVITSKALGGDTHIHLVDLQIAFNESTDLGSDWHPNVTGQQKIADKLITEISAVMTSWTGTTTYTLTASVSPTGAGTVALSPTGGSYPAGTSVQLTATANTGYTFSSWTGNASGTSSPVTVVVNSNKTITATFNTAVTYTLTTVVSPTGGGTAALNPTGGIYTAGTTVTATATPATSYIFSGWSGAASGTASPVTVTMNANKTVTAAFTYSSVITYTLTTGIAPTGAGTISLNPGGGTYSAGTSVQVTATVATGYTFSSWTGSATGTANPVTVVVDADKTVTATFTVNPVTENPVLSVSPASLAFGETELGVSKSLTFNITNTGTGTLSGSISTDQSWFTVSPINLSGDTEITVTANTTGLTAGQAYTGTITITSNGGNGSVAVTIAVATGGETTAEVTPSPNPFILRQDQVDKITFKGAGASGTEIKIYTLSGQLVRTITKEGSSDFSWDGLNDAGEKAVSGIYVYVVTGIENKSTGRIAVIR